MKRVTKPARKVGDLVTPVAERKKEKDKDVEHGFKKGEKLTIDRFAKWKSKDGTKNYWCSNEEGYEQVMNEKEIVDYK